MFGPGGVPGRYFPVRTPCASEQEGENAHLPASTGRDDEAFGDAPQYVVLRLVAHRQRNRHVPGDSARGVDLAGGPLADPVRADLPRRNEIGERPDHLRQRLARVEAVRAQQVDVVGAQLRQAGVDAGDDVAPGQAALTLVTSGEVHLGRDDVRVAWHTAQRTTERRVRAEVRVRRVEEVDTELERRSDELLGRGLV